MSYLVLARKHRPRTFEEVVGQQHVTRTLAGALGADRVAHAFMFAGPRGVGKTSVARILAKALNCVEGPTPTPCGKCTHCLEIEAGNSLDVQEIDAASNSRVEDVRELREMIRFRPQAAHYRITILDEVHMLSKAAFNALLKTLEEPPEHAVFILATTDVHRVPLTILSRCQRYDFRRLPPKVLAEHLGRVLDSEGCSLPPESLNLMAREADGSVRDSLSLLDQVLSLGRDQMTHPEVVELLGLVDRELVAACAEAVLAADPARVLDLVGRLYAAGGEIQAFYGALQEEFRNLAAARAASEGADLFGLTAEEVAGLRTRAAQVSPETLHEIFDHLARAEELFRRAGQPRLVLEMTLLKLTQVRPVLSLDDLIQGLGNPAALEPRRAAPPPSAPPAPALGGGSAPPAPSRPAPGAPSAPPETAAPQAGPPPSGPGRPLPGAAQALKELADYLGRSEPMLASQVGRGEAMIDGETLCVTLPGGHTAQRLCNAATEAKLCRMGQELWSQLGGVRLTTGEETPPPQEPDQEAMKALAGLAEHPAVQEAMEVFEVDHPVRLIPESPTE